MAIRSNISNGADDAPPSTLAAQIVHNIEDVNEQAKTSSSRAHVRELLKLILEDVEQSRGHQRSSLEVIEENRRLIVVIVKLCIATVTGDDPFEDHVALQAEAAQCLAVVELTAKRYPDALFHSPRNNSGTKLAGPIVFWLLSSLVLLSGNSNWINVRQAALKAIQACINVESKAASGTVGLHVITRFLHGLAKGEIDSCKTELAKSFQIL